MRTSFVSLSLLSTALFACGDAPPAPSDVRGTLKRDLSHVLGEFQAAADGSTKNLPTGAAFAFATSALEANGGLAPMKAPIARLLAATNRAANVSMDRKLAADEGSPAGSTEIDALIDMLNNELFTDANHLGDGIYQVPVSMVCGVPVETECAIHATQAQLRVRVEEDEGLRFWLQVDANHDEPLGFLLRSNELAMTVNLDEATDAMIALAPLFGERAPNADLSGELTASLTVLGTAHAAAALSFDRPISIKIAEQGVNLDSPNAFRFTSAAAQVLAVDLDGVVQKAKVDLGLGETTLHVATADDFDLHPTDMFLAGATVNATYQGNTLALDNLSLGMKTSTISVGGQQGLAIDLNGNSGRKLNATITADPATGTETLTVSPRFDLRTTIDHAVLGDDVPVYDVTHVMLEGALRSSPLGDRVAVTAGRFYITTNPAEYGFVASAGDCVFATENFDDETFSSWTSYSVGACTKSLRPHDEIGGERKTR